VKRECRDSAPPPPLSIGQQTAIPRSFTLVRVPNCAAIIIVIVVIIAASPAIAARNGTRRVPSTPSVACLSLSLSRSRFYQVAVTRRPRSRGRRGYSFFLPARFSRASRRNIARQLCQTRPDCDICSSCSCTLHPSGAFFSFSPTPRTQPLPFLSRTLAIYLADRSSEKEEKGERESRPIVKKSRSRLRVDRTRDETVRWNPPERVTAKETLLSHPSATFSRLSHTPEGAFSQMPTILSDCHRAAASCSLHSLVRETIDSTRVTRGVEESSTHHEDESLQRHCSLSPFTNILNMKIASDRFSSSQKERMSAKTLRALQVLASPGGTKAPYSSRKQRATVSYWRSAYFLVTSPRETRATFDAAPGENDAQRFHIRENVPSSSFSICMA